MMDRLLVMIAVVGVICFYIGLGVGYALYRGGR